MFEKFQVIANNTISVTHNHKYIKQKSYLEEIITRGDFAVFNQNIGARVSIFALELKRIVF